ncbi:MAG: VWA domain-containing protein [Acidobacteriota bacterium]
MQARNICKDVTKMGCIALLAFVSLASQHLELANTRRIYVIAVRTCWDASLFDSTYRLGDPQRRLRVPVKQAPFRAPELLFSGYATTPGGAPDPTGKARIEKEFQKQKKYSIVSSAMDADLIFLAETRTRSFVGATMKPTEGPKSPEFKWPRPQAGGDWTGPEIVFPSPEGRGTFFGELQDEKPNLFSLAMAIAVPVGAYQRSPDDSAALYVARVWEGIVSSSNGKSVSLEGLVKKFHEGGKLPRVSAISTNPQPPRALPGMLTREARTAPSGEVSPASGQKPNASAANTTIRADVELVTVPVIAADGNGKYVSDLRQSELHIFEDDVEQKIDRFISEDEPFSVALLIDTSVSMRFSDLEIQRAALDFAPTLRPDDRVMIVSFNSRVYLDSEFSGNREQIIRAISQMHKGENTRLYDAIKLAMEERLRFVLGRKAIVLFTDGLDTASDPTNEAGALEEIEQSDVPVYVIQYDTRNRTRLPSSWTVEKAPEGYLDRDQVYAHAAQYLQDLSIGSGGHYEQAADSETARAAFARVSGNLRHQYTICYYPTNHARDGSLRHIHVIVDRPGVKLRARTSYRAGAQQASDKSK